jgi:hypothetical protein
LQPKVVGKLVQPVAGLQLSSVHGLPSLQLAARPLQVSAAQLSGPVQALPSLQGVPFNTLKSQPPDALKQLSLVQALPSVHSLGLPAAQAPSLQLSPTVQGSPSWHSPLAGV